MSNIKDSPIILAVAILLTIPVLVVTALNPRPYNVLFCSWYIACLLGVIYFKRKSK